jgi:heme oxygenase
MSLKDLTWEKHKSAERQDFVRVMFSGNIDPAFYATFLANQHPCYEILEVNAMLHRLVLGMPDIRRAPAILADVQELWTDTETKPKIVPVVNEYIKHIMTLSANDPEKLMAHIYVRHMGDLAGGQMIAKRVPGAGRLYKFEEPDALKEAIRARINDDLAEEANICFDFAIRMFKELMDLDMPKLKESIDE